MYLFLSGGFSLASHNHLAQIGEVLCRLLSSISSKDLSSSVRVIIGFLVTSLSKVLLVRLLGLVAWPALGSLGSFIFFLFALHFIHLKKCLKTRFHFVIME
jgi:hypothetical protein